MSAPAEEEAGRRNDARREAVHDRPVFGERQHRAAFGLRVGTEDHGNVLVGQLVQWLHGDQRLRLIVEEVEVHRLSVDPAVFVDDVLVELDHGVQFAAEIRARPGQRVDHVDDERILARRPGGGETKDRQYSDDREQNAHATRYYASDGISGSDATVLNVSSPRSRSTSDAHVVAVA